MHVRLADEAVCIGPPAARDSYLNKAAILTAASITGADAIHPGYGFLSENADFAEMVEAQGLQFIGPAPDHIRMMGDKIQAKAAMMRGSACRWCPARTVPSLDVETALELGRQHRLPAAGQGLGRRRRAGDEGGARPPRSCPRRCASPKRRGPRRVRQRRGLYRALPRQAAAHRAAGAGRQPRGRWCTWASATARCSAATRSCWRRRVRRHSAAAQRDDDRRDGDRPHSGSSGTATPARWSSSTRTGISPSSR